MNNLCRRRIRRRQTQQKVCRSLPLLQLEDSQLLQPPCSLSLGFLVLKNDKVSADLIRTFLFFIWSDGFLLFVIFLLNDPDLHRKDFQADLVFEESRLKLREDGCHPKRREEGGPSGMI